MAIRGCWAGRQRSVLSSASSASGLSSSSSVQREGGGVLCFPSRGSAKRQARSAVTNPPRCCNTGAEERVVLRASSSKVKAGGHYRLEREQQLQAVSHKRRQHTNNMTASSNQNQSSTSNSVLTAHSMDLSKYGIRCKNVMRNPCAGRLYEDALRYDGASVTSTGALATLSFAKTGRSPKDKRIVDHPESHDDIWWGNVNIPLGDESFQVNKRRACDYLSVCERVYVIDGYGGWDPAYRVKVRVISSRPYHALFMQNMMIRPNHQELMEDFSTVDYVIYNAGEFFADPSTPGMTSETSVALNLEAGELVILGTQYAGEMKKGLFTIMNYLMPKYGVLSMHASANEDPNTKDIAVFFGLSGTGKTTLSADPRRMLIGDDEICWTDTGVFNIEGGCYAKCIDLSAEKEPEIFGAVKFGTVVENTVQDPDTGMTDYHDTSITENTRASYPIEFIPNAKIPCIGGHPKNVVFLACDAFGVLPPISKLTAEQAMYHFISGYSAKVAGTEVGVTEPTATFSACFGAPFMVWHPAVYAELLAKKMKFHGAKAWLVNTGWSGGSYGVGSRMKLGYTRAIVNAIHAGLLDDVETVIDPVFGVEVPTSCPGVPSEVLIPRNAWKDKSEYQLTATKLARLFIENFQQFAEGASSAVRAAGPKAVLESTSPKDITIPKKYYGSPVQKPIHVRAAA
eukprot:jgi/Chlat1/9294/Chrsp99S08501